MTQTQLPLTLRDRVTAWALAHDGGTFAALCDAMGLDATTVDQAARHVLAWGDGGYYVGRVAAEEQGCEVQ